MRLPAILDVGLTGKEWRELVLALRANGCNCHYFLMVRKGDGCPGCFWALDEADTLRHLVFLRRHASESEWTAETE